MDGSWKVLNLRGVIFAGENPSATEIWQSIMGGIPANSANQASPVISTAGGPFNEGWLTITVTFERVDLLYSINATIPQTDLTDFPTAGPFEERLEPFTKLFEKAVTTANKRAKRIAFCSHLFRPAESKVKAYEDFVKWTPRVKLDPNTASDVIFQINHPVEINIDSRTIVINRLMKWAVLVFQAAVVSPTETKNTTIRLKIGTSLETDCNTSVEQSLVGISDDGIHALLMHLVADTIKVSNEGDVL